MNDQAQCYAGVDWGSQSHCVFLADGEGRKMGERTFKHGGEGLAEMAAWLLSASGAAEPGRIHVAIEVPHGPVVEALIERGFSVHAINPKQMDRFRVLSWNQHPEPNGSRRATPLLHFQQ
jgi:hypothetical protein